MKNYKKFSDGAYEGDDGYIAPGEEKDCNGYYGGALRYYCTLDQGHQPPHAAHGLGGRLIATWEDE